MTFQVFLTLKKFEVFTLLSKYITHFNVVLMKLPEEVNKTLQSSSLMHYNSCWYSSSHCAIYNSHKCTIGYVRDFILLSQLFNTLLWKLIEILEL